LLGFRDQPGGFELARQRSAATIEGWVEDISHRPRGLAELRMVLEDGRLARTRLTRDELEWHGLAVGQIVLVRAVR
jgi:hypothetical protein